MHLALQRPDVLGWGWGYKVGSLPSLRRRGWGMAGETVWGGTKRGSNWDVK